ncbi:zinc finger protein Xfin-like [Leguminivora glycinivorella]|uniref:zinc finger protein Xfin-like n=1 Tax=Leguminivora glycinivorella TaxID=1035111 RepID=UPI00200BB5EF|nr:zinc finger protein Xfin-like [Leguminivora glycinivorella]
MGACEVESCGKDSIASHVVVDAVGMVHGLTQLANLPDPPNDAIQTILSSVQYKTHQPETAAEIPTQKPRKRKSSPGNEEYSCEYCSRSYRYKWNLKRHVEESHPVKLRRLVNTAVFECEECDFTCASQEALDTHSKQHNSTEKTKSPRSKCAFCDKECVGIYNHYISHHCIENPEEIMFDNGNVLVISSINPEKGKAAWFLKEKEKLNQYTDTTCRLCETEPCFDNRYVLESHYELNHMVDPNMLGNIKHVFRAQKGAHLPASQTPKRKQADIRTPMKQKVSFVGNEDKQGGKDNSEKKVENQVKKPEQSGFSCQECGQVYSSEAAVNKHRNEIHTPKAVDKSKQPKYPCCFCNKSIIGIYKHYGNRHSIDDPEQIMFNTGNVLVRADIDTKSGQAPWFKSQKEKAEKKYSANMCRLCDADFSGTDVSLDRHYLKGHKVDQDALKRLDNLQCLFRADKRAHLDDLPASTPKAKLQRTFQRKISLESKHKSGPSTERDVNEEESEQDVSGLIIYQCGECEVAATTCDASIEHAQLHHFPRYSPIIQTCAVCNFSFEAQCFADHSSNHLNNNDYKVVKFYPSKLLDDWSVMFQGLSETHAARIRSSSTYQHTRRVKMNSDVPYGIPVYQCGKCELYIRPKDVETHCYNNICLENQTPGHFCSDCEIYFFTSVALTEHEKDHKNYGPDSFRTVTFNRKEDELINRALQNIQNNAVSKEARNKTETPQKNRGKEITVIEDVVISVFCSHCKQSIMYSEFEAHAATHNNENGESSHTTEEVRNIPEINGHNSGEVVQQTVVDGEEIQRAEELSQEGNNEVNLIDGHESGEVNLQTGVNDKVTNGGGTVEPWNSDTDSCNNLLAPVSSFDVRVEVHVQNQEEYDTNNFECIDILEDFSEEMANDLKHDIQKLGAKLFGMTYIPDDIVNNEDIKSEKSELTQHGGTSDDNQDHVNDEDKMIEATKNRNDSDSNDIIVEIDDDSDSEIEFQAVDRKSGAKPSSRDILSRMLSKEE